jgi:hypothetical protein
MAAHPTQNKPINFKSDIKKTSFLGNNITNWRDVTISTRLSQEKSIKIVQLIMIFFAQNNEAALLLSALASGKQVEPLIKIIEKHGGNLGISQIPEAL